MFLVLGTLAIVTAIGTVILGLNGKKAEVLRFISVSLPRVSFVSFVVSIMYSPEKQAS